MEKNNPEKDIEDLYKDIGNYIKYGFVWKCWVNIPNEIAICHRDNDQQNHWV